MHMELMDYQMDQERECLVSGSLTHSVHNMAVISDNHGKFPYK